MRTGVVVHDFPSAANPGRGTYLHATVAALAQHPDVSALTVFHLDARPIVGRGPAPTGPDGPPLEADGATGDTPYEVITIGYPTVPLLSRWCNPVVARGRLQREMAGRDLDVVLGYWLFPEGHAAVGVARRMGVPAVLGALGSDVYSRRGVSRWLTRRAIARADAVMAVSEALRRALVAQLGAEPTRTHCVPNGVDRHVFSPPADSDHGVEDRQRSHVLYVGRLVESKGLGELLDAHALLRNERPAELTLIGQGPMRAALEAQAHRLGIGDSVHLLGVMDPRGVAEHLRAADLLVLPSWSEGHPNVLLEAGACGVPVVATSVGGVMEIVDADSGVVVPPRDVPALVEGLRLALTRDWDRRHIAASAQRSWDDAAAETVAVLHSVQRSG